MALAAIPEMLKGKASEISGKRCELTLASPCKRGAGGHIHVDDNDKQMWVNAFTLKHNTYTLSTCEGRLPTIVCRGNSEKTHKMTRSIYTHLFHSSFMSKMLKENNHERPAYAKSSN